MTFLTDNQLIKLGDPIVLRPAPVLRKARFVVNSVVVDLGCITVLFVRTAKGEAAYKFEVRSNRYARKKEMGTLIHTLAKHVYGDYQRRWREANHAAIRQREKTHYENNKEEINRKRRAAYAARKALR